MNRWNIPEWLEHEVIERDRKCIYCSVEFVATNGKKKSKPTWEHIVNDARIINRENIARCCFSCNASKGAKDLSTWLESNYCKKNGITKDTIAYVAKMALINPPKIDNSANIEKIINDSLMLPSQERVNLAKLILENIDPDEANCIIEDMKKGKNKIKHFAIFPWLQQAEDDLSVAKTETVPSFIRCYHAQQAIEKVLKAAFVVLNGKFHNDSKALNAERKNFKVKIKSYVPNYAWELTEDLKLPYTHDLVYLWNKLGKVAPSAFAPLNIEQKQFMRKAAAYADKYRYPYFSDLSGLQMGFIPEQDVQAVVQLADILYPKVRHFICDHTQKENKMPNKTLQRTR